MKKKLFFTMMISLLIVFLNPINAQITDKEFKKELKSKPAKKARKEAKRLKKQGYSLTPGSPPLEIVLENSWKYDFILNEDGEKRYFIANGIVVGETHVAAKVQAYNMAKIELSGKITTKVASIVGSKIANMQINTEDATSITETIAKSKTLVSEEIGRVITLMELYRNIGKNVEVNIRVAYDSEVAYKIAKRILRKKLEDKINISDEELDELLNF